MRIIRRSKIFPGDLKSLSVVKNFNRFTRVGIIDSVNIAKGVVRLRWMDKPGVREFVAITQANDGEWHMPKKNSVVIVAFDIQEQARIIRYINVGQVSKLKTFALPALAEGEKFWEVGGSSFYMRADGSVILKYKGINQLVLDSNSNTFNVRTVNWKVSTSGGNTFFGQVKRYIMQSDGTKVSQIVKNLEQDSYIEYTFNLFETSEAASSLIPVTPLIQATLGTIIDPNGKVLDINGQPVLNDAQSVCLSFKITKDLVPVFSLLIDKLGNVTATTLGKINLTAPALIANAPSINMNSGINGAARLGDTVTVIIKSSDIANLGLQASGSNLTQTFPATVSVKGTITSASKTVNIGD